MNSNKKNVLKANYVLGETEKMNMYQAINHGLRIALKNDPDAGNETSKIFYK